ncbi:Kinetochore scaffold 1 [Varanus komodoensis]|nr:Kinetochore scaffold 1 [Varanus komodoensis]
MAILENPKETSQTLLLHETKFSKMDTIFSEMSEEKDITHKRRVSSILKAPRTPLCDIGSGNELNQDFNIEKRQKNSRRVSFADTIRVFPPDLQNIVELKHGETAREVRDQDPFNKNEDPEDVQCEITGKYESNSFLNIQNFIVNCELS